MQADVLGQNVISCFEFVDARLCMMHLDVARPQALAARPQGTSRVLRLSSKVASVGGKTPMDKQSLVGNGCEKNNRPSKFQFLPLVINLMCPFAVCICSIFHIYIFGQKFSETREMAALQGSGEGPFGPTGHAQLADPFFAMPSAISFQYLCKESK